MKKPVPQRLLKSQRKHLREYTIPITIKGVTEQIEKLRACAKEADRPISTTCYECCKIAQRLKIPVYDHEMKK